jgi:hypothetical protein
MTNKKSRENVNVSNIPFIPDIAQNPRKTRRPEPGGGGGEDQL